ncbi:hypothetical protein BGW36DRAFT_435504 [Talaromyces proteolyticus]|uniref:Carbonic anhydrase n=1 Tax=Talaromyces proteolyticus TaxID=1131652 RepID=A0AAD4L139_9EURO|nr:uncharacterized protein BGW36DRAFT_435504 [Talaromyces proteolyticus]KAH8705617.1 hypothetical protein BGW36DRAFT_435504 [Talaromyces proteolyticus]
MFTEALVSRNAGGHVKLDEVLILDDFLGLREIMVVQHTDCGATHFDIPKFHQTLKRRVSEDLDLENNNFGFISDLKESVRKEVHLMRQSPLMRQEIKDHIFGFIFDIKTGLLEQVA